MMAAKKNPITLAKASSKKHIENESAADLNSNPNIENKTVFYELLQNPKF